MKKLLLFLFLGSFVFSGVSFNKSIVYGGLDGTVTVEDAYGVDFDIDKISLGYDTSIGLLVKKAVKAGPLESSIRIGWNETSGTSTLGVGYNWWSGGDIINTSIGVILDYTTAGASNEDILLRLNIGWGF